MAAGLGPLLGRRKVADNSFKPHVKALVLKAFNRHRHAPLYIAGYRPVPQPFLQVTQGKTVNIGSPLFLHANPFREPALKITQFQEKVLRVFENRGGGAYAAVGGNQFC